MKKTTYQVPEIRDENDNIVQEGTFGKKSAFVSSSNDGAFDYILNNLEALHDAQTDSASTFTTEKLTVAGTTTAATLKATDTTTESLNVTGSTSVPTANADNNSNTVANTAYVDAAMLALHDTIKSELLKVILPSTAAAHNSLYRGKDLTEYWNSGDMSKAIEAGTFDDIFPGDYIIKSVTIDGTAYNNIKWIVGDLDYFLHRGATETVEHHLILFPENNIGTAQMNSTNTTANGYQGSDMWKNVIPKYTTGIVNAFGSDHVLEHAELITNAMNANAASASGAGLMGSAYWDWAGSYGNTDGSYPYVKVKVNIFNQAMMFGNHPFASSGHEEGNCSKQLAAFRYGQNFTRAYLCWLRDVASANHFAIADIDSGASIRSASNVGGVRPYFLLH